MSVYNEDNWKETLTSVYQRAAIDPIYRDVCLNDPVGAITQVSDIELPPDFSVRFFDSPATYEHTYLLPPALDSSASSEDQIKAVIGGMVTQGFLPRTN